MLSKIRTSLICLIVLLSTENSFSQCFSSPGNPVGGTASMGVLEKNTLRFASHYRYLKSNTAFDGSKKIPSDVLPFSSGTYNYLSVMGGYGINNKLTIELEGGYFINKIYKYNTGTTSKGWGFSNLSFLAKYAILQNLSKGFEIDIAAGVKMPLRNKAQVIDNVEVPVDLQSSTGNYGITAEFQAIKEYSFHGIRFFYISRYENYFPNNRNFFLSRTIYEFGDFYMNSLYFSKHMKLPWENEVQHWTIIGQLRHEYKKRNIRDNKTINASGSSVIFLSPQINYTIENKYNISAIFELPVYRYYNGKQLGSDYSFMLAFNVHFSGNH